MDLLALPPLVFCVVKLHGLRVLTRGTTADFARRWSLAAAFVCIVATVCKLTADSIRLASAAQYFAAVMLLTPFVAILGARRPGAGAWPWFVVLPLVLVLQWPTISQLSAGNAGTPITVPTPTAIGFLFVLTMGAGNYFGTLNTGAMLSVVLGTVLILTGTTEFGSVHPSWTFTVGCWFLAAGSLLIPGRFFVTRNSNDASGVGHGDLWRDFRDVYGIVWAKRVMDRVNQFADREKWPVEMSLDGFQQRPSADAPDTHPVPAENVPDRAIEILCWILKRFVNSDFLQRYLLESSIVRSEFQQ